MGDCRIRFQIASSLLLLTAAAAAACPTESSSLLLLSNNSTSSRTPTTTTTETTTIVRVVAADSTVHELLQGTPLWLFPQEDHGKQTAANTKSSHSNSNTIPTVLDLIDQCGATVWDCTVHPGSNITAQCRAQHTLYTAGWFPSGTLQILPAHANRPLTVAAEAYDDNLNNHSSNEQAETTTTGEHGHRPLPSQLLQSVTQRHAPHDDVDNTRRHALLLRQQNRQLQHQKQQARDAKHEARLDKLRRQNASKSTAVSLQVQRMLVQSRATPAGSARPDLPMADRVYLHCLLLVWPATSSSSSSTTTTTTGSSGSSAMDLEHASSDWVHEDYRYYSHQDTVGRVLASFEDRPSSSSSKSNEKMSMELLVSQSIVVLPTATIPELNGTSPTTTNIPEITRYRRLPVTMRLYEAISKSYLSGKVDTVVIRWYDNSQDEGTLSILANDDNDEEHQHQHSIDVDLDEADTTNAAHEEAKVPLANAGSDSIPIAPSIIADDNASNDEGASSSDDKYQHMLSVALMALDQDTTAKMTKKKKPSSSTSAAAKVRQMQMKSQARGDAKRVKNMADRFFFELVLARGNDEAPPLRLESLGPMFLARTDPIDRLLRDCLAATVALPARPLSDGTRSWELWCASPTVPIGRSNTASDTATTHNNLQRIATSQDESHRSWQDLEQQGKVQNFDRLLLLLL